MSPILTLTRAHLGDLKVTPPPDEIPGKLMTSAILTLTPGWPWRSWPKNCWRKWPHCYTGNLLTISSVKATPQHTHRFLNHLCSQAPWCCHLESLKMRLSIVTDISVEKYRYCKVSNIIYIEYIYIEYRTKSIDIAIQYRASLPPTHPHTHTKILF